ncbi:hypothetical protein K8S19_02805 [bacterium]|nr:hypothetical protein [bacterium]
MSKYLRVVASAIFIVIISSSCSFRLGSSYAIINENLELFTQQRDFKSKIIKNYKIDDTVVCPFFRHEKDNVFSVFCSVYNNGETEREITIESLELEHEGIRNIRHINEKKKLIKEKDQYWGENVYFAGFVLTRNEEIAINSKNTITVILNVSVDDGGKLQQKKIKYDFEFEHKYFLVDYTQ